MGEKAFKQMCLAFMRQDKLPADAEQRVVAEQAKTGITSLILSAQKAFGAARLTSAAKAADFMPMVVGDESSVIVAGGGFMCDACGTQVKYDSHWTKATGTGQCSDWFCGACGAPYDKSKMAGLLVLADKRHPEASFMLKARMTYRHNGEPAFGDEVGEPRSPW
mgnify:CR=1 FL=1